MALIPLQETISKKQTTGQILLSFGFRLFFLLAGLSAVTLIALWLMGLHGWSAAFASHYGAHWHSHEMLFGYTTAVVAGFLLTAAKNWTGQHTAIGKPLLVLGLCWLAARSLIWVDNALLQWLGVACDLLLLPLLAYFVARPILAIKQQRNYIFPVLLVVLTLVHFFMHFAFFKNNNVWVLKSLYAVLFVIMTIMVIMACRVVPFFTERGLSLQTPIKRDERHDLWCAMSIAAAGVAYVFSVPWLSSILLSVAAIVLLSRIVKWYQQGIWQVPLLWVLHIGMLWLVIGLVLLALQTLPVVSFASMGSSAIHALTVGCIGMMTLGMMSRVSLGHSGRILTVTPVMHLAFMVLNIAAVLRVFGTWLFHEHYLPMIDISGALWIVAFLLFLWVYAPIFMTASKV